MKKILFIITSALVVIIIGWWWHAKITTVKNLARNEAPIPRMLSFDDCLGAGHPILESYPRRCKTPDGRTFVEELTKTMPTYINATSGVISVSIPTPDAVTGKEFEIHGIARGWYFEGSFPVEVLDKNSKTLTTTFAQAQSDWMTSDPVQFIAKVKIPANYIGKATIVLKKDNPSGLPTNDASMSYPITIEY